MLPTKKLSTLTKNRNILGDEMKGIIMIVAENRSPVSTHAERKSKIKPNRCYG